MTWINKFNSALLLCGAAVCASHLLECLVSRYALLDGIHELAHVYELVSASFIVCIEVLLGDITLCKLQVANAFCLGSEEGTCLADEALA